MTGVSNPWPETAAHAAASSTAVRARARPAASAGGSRRRPLIGVSVARRPSLATPHSPAARPPARHQRLRVVTASTPVPLTPAPVPRPAAPTGARGSNGRAAPETAGCAGWSRSRRRRRPRPRPRTPAARGDRQRAPVVNSTPPPSETHGDTTRQQWATLPRPFIRHVPRGGEARHKLRGTYSEGQACQPTVLRAVQLAGIDGPFPALTKHAITAKREPAECKQRLTSAARHWRTFD